jgi:hypothetical protein
MPVAIQITDRYHLVSNLSEAVERDVQKLQPCSRATAESEASRKHERMTKSIEARRQRCRQAGYQRYTAVHHQAESCSSMGCCRASQRHPAGQGAPQADSDAQLNASGTSAQPAGSGRGPEDISIVSRTGGSCPRSRRPFRSRKRWKPTGTLSRISRWERCVITVPP